MPTQAKGSKAITYQGTVPAAWVETIEAYQRETGLTESALIRAALRSLIGKRALPESDIQRQGRPPRQTEG